MRHRKVVQHISEGSYFGGRFAVAFDKLAENLFFADEVAIFIFGSGSFYFLIGVGNGFLVGGIGERTSVFAFIVDVTAKESFSLSFG